MPDPTDKRALYPADLLLSAICTAAGIDVMGADRYGPAREACERFVESVRAPEAEDKAACDHVWSSPHKDAPPIACIRCGAPKVVDAPSERDLCVTSPFVSRMCERGTRGCNVRHDAPSEEGEGPEVWIIFRRGEPREHWRKPPTDAELASLRARGDDAVRYIPAAAADRRIAELEAERDRAYADCREMRVALDLRAPDGSAAVNEAAKLIEERDTAVKRAEEAEMDLAAAERRIETLTEALSIATTKADAAGRERDELGDRWEAHDEQQKRDLERARAALFDADEALTGSIAGYPDSDVCRRIRAALSPASLDADREEEMAKCSNCGGTKRELPADAEAGKETR